MPQVPICRRNFGFLPILFDNLRRKGPLPGQLLFQIPLTKEEREQERQRRIAEIKARRQRRKWRNYYR